MSKGWFSRVGTHLNVVMKVVMVENKYRDRFQMTETETVPCARRSLNLVFRLAGSFSWTEILPY